MIEVKLIKNGPILIKSEEGINVTDEEGKITPCFSPIAICNCGKSKDGNFCDGSHSKKRMNNFDRLETVRNMIINDELTITDVIKVVIELNGIIGVGLISLGDNLQEYCYKYKKIETND